jgi:hypothetical protein
MEIDIGNFVLKYSYPVSNGCNDSIEAQKSIMCNLAKHVITNYV